MLALPTNGDNVFIPLVNENVSYESKLRTYVAIVLDKSGSMQNIIDPTIQGFNSQVDSIIKEAPGEVLLSLVTFNEHVDPIFFNKSPSHFTRLSRSNYKPKGWTALYDAVGYTIRRLENEVEHSENSAFLVIIVSDGEENRSRDYTSYTLGSLIQRKRTTNKWTFVYVGSNQDLSQVAAKLYIPIGNTFTWTNDLQGTNKAFSTTTSAVANYMSLRSAGETSSETFYNGSETKTAP